MAIIEQWSVLGKKERCETAHSESVLCDKTDEIAFRESFRHCIVTNLPPDDGGQTTGPGRSGTADSTRPQADMEDREARYSSRTVSSDGGTLVYHPDNSLQDTVSVGKVFSPVVSNQWSVVTCLRFRNGFTCY